MKLTIAGKPMSKWDQRFVELAKYVSQWSKDKAQVGAVLFSKPGGGITVGYNGFPMGLEDPTERLKDQKLKRDITVHAEVNTIVAAGERARGATLYVWGKPICARCAGPIIQSGIKRVVASSPDTDDGDWKKLGELAYQMFLEAGIAVDFYVAEKEDAG
jgi:dCMP deaminase